MMSTPACCDWSPALRDLGHVPGVDTLSSVCDLQRGSMDVGGCTEDAMV